MKKETINSDIIGVGWGVVVTAQEIFPKHLSHQQNLLRRLVSIIAVNMPSAETHDIITNDNGSNNNVDMSNDGVQLFSNDISNLVTVNESPLLQAEYSEKNSNNIFGTNIKVIISI